MVSCTLVKVKDVCSDCGEYVVDISELSTDLAAKTLQESIAELNCGVGTCVPNQLIDPHLTNRLSSR